MEKYIKDFCFKHIFNINSDIHINIMSYINGYYFKDLIRFNKYMGC